MIGQAWIGMGAATLGGALLAALLYRGRWKRAVAELELQRTRHGQFLGMVSHELRTPLSSVLAFAEFLEDELGGPLLDEQRVFVNRIQGATLQLQRLVDDLLDYNRITQGRFQLAMRPMEYRHVATSIAAQAQPAFELKGQTLALRLPEQPICLQGDPERLGQVLLNLLSNASRYTPDGSRIELAVRRDGRELETSVRDDGPGIAPEALERIFQPFVQVASAATPRQSGLGLGLAIARGLVQAHGGTLEAESTLGAGTTFRIRIPLGSSGATHSLEHPAATQPLEPPLARPSRA